ncbi:MAG TPA: response regulator transcription factor [Anaerolineales bacterium]|nr:response regulator transcription factor [Anaerolineales bacterium]
MALIHVLPIVEVRLIANIFADVLDAAPDIAVVGCCTNPEDALQMIQEQQVDVALVSVGLPDQSALEVIRAIIKVSPSTKVLVLGLSEEADDVLNYIEAGAAGYILKDNSLNDLVEVLRSTQRGEAQVSPKMAGIMIERLSSLARMFSTVETGLTQNVRLTPREQEVLQCIGKGCTNQEIASLLLVEIGTVKNHVHNILEKLNVSNRNEAASYLSYMKK